MRSPTPESGYYISQVSPQFLSAAAAGVIRNSGIPSRTDRPEIDVRREQGCKDSTCATINFFADLFPAPFLVEESERNVTIRLKFCQSS